MKKILLSMMITLTTISLNSTADMVFNYQIPQPNLVTNDWDGDGQSNDVDTDDDNDGIDDSVDDNPFSGRPVFGGGSQTPTPSIDSFIASESTITEGDTVTLSWTLSNANTVTLSESTLSPSGIDVSSQSSAQFTISSAGSYNFNLDVDGSVQSSVAVTVEAPIDPWSQTYTDPVRDSSWTQISTRFNPTVSDATWVNLRDNMSVGIIVVLANGHEIFSPKEILNNTQCEKIKDIDSIQSSVIIAREDNGCNGTGSDYDVITIANTTINPEAFSPGYVYLHGNRGGHNSLFPNYSAGSSPIYLDSIYIK